MRALPLVMVVGAIAAPAAAQVFHNESINGDLSNNRLAPTAYTLNPGTRSLLATTGGGDRDFLAITIPAGASLTQINLISYQGLDEVAFIGVISGPQFTEDPGNPNVANILGYTHFGPSLLGTDILDNMGTGAGAIGFAPPLTAGTYSFWLNQLGGAVNYRMDFVVVPAPAGVVLLAAGALPPLSRRRR